MKLILLSGGSGKRLWPLSNTQRSKQFLKVLETENGDAESMLQRVWRQLEAVGLANDTFIATENSQLEMIESQIEIDPKKIILEPERRDTFAAIALSTTYLKSLMGIDENEVVCVLPVDPYTELSFFEKIKELENLFNESSAELGLIGINPTFPSEKYGYIIPKSSSTTTTTFEVDYFKEKPTTIIAKELLNFNAVWNAGVFAFKLKKMNDILLNYSLPLNYTELLHRYIEIPKNSFDYEFVEKAQSIFCIRYDGFWKDLGTWNTLTEEMSKESIGEVVLTDDCYNTNIINELDIPIVAIGLKNIVVAASPDGIMVSDKESSPKIKDIFNESIKLAPMYQEKKWGSITTYSNKKDYKIELIKISRGSNYSLDSEEHVFITILNGSLINKDTNEIFKTGNILNDFAGETLENTELLKIFLKN
ncbi:sugar phosphate nucleotidyltransferase [Carnobacterium gallinarum]|uniref:sugar phosphate nucleotidyltransferase n=1 Tax=Carnobacterium gallinarum TaxID=2749 RepID=UPI00068F1576|nr:sugar phosphate nucleotidyltransferase [Carnobacterium gallinarum]